MEGLDLSVYKKKARKELNDALTLFDSKREAYKADIFKSIDLIFSHKNCIQIEDVSFMDMVLKRKFIREHHFIKLRTKGSNLFSVREFGNDCLLYSLDELLRYGDVLNLIQADETDRVVERKEIPLFDNKAFREAVINAVLHNKWVEGNEPMISVFSDRIEILSRGTLAPAQTMEGFFLGESIPVNEKLSEIFLQLHISEKSGRGVPKITEMYGKDAFSFRENSIVVTIPFERINKVGNKVGKKVGDKKPLNSRRQKIISEMRDNPNITTAELHNILGVSETAVEKNISFLRDNGYIERVGSKKAGYWKVL